MSKLARWFGRLSFRPNTKMRLPQQHQKVTTTYSFDSVDYEEIGLPERWLEEDSTRVGEGLDTRKSFWSRFKSSKLFTRSRNQDKTPKSSPSRSFSWLPGVARRHSSPETDILREQLQEDQNQLTQWRLNESDLMKRRGYFCATNRPRICVCDCPDGTYSKLRAKEQDSLSRMTTSWDARWVFLGDLKRLEEESNERIEKMLFY